MAKKAAKTSSDSLASAGASPARSTKKKAAEPIAPKHVKAQASAVAAAVEGFVSAIVNPTDPEVRKASRQAKAAEPEVDTVEGGEDTVEQELATQPVIVDQSVAELSRPSETEVTQTQAPTAQAEVTEDDIRTLAYIYFLERDGQGGSEADDWIRAERALKSGTAS